ncbi:MAG: phage tail sheath subtilisin-like domain-containing protein [Methylophagaceae bacterium]
MAETILSPGVLARENDSSVVQEQPVTVGSAIVGPTALGPVEIPTVVTTYSQFKAIFGGAIESGSNSYNYMTGISAYNYFQNGGESLLVTRVTSGSFSPAESTKVNTNITDGDLVQTADTLLNGISAGFNITSSLGNGPGTVASVPMTGSLAGVDALGSITYATSESISSITITTAGTGFAAGETITIPSSSAGADKPGGADLIITLEASDINYKDAFDLDTLSEGVVMNNEGAQTEGALASGSADNVRWEIVSSNSSSGVFSLLVRRGNDNNREKAVLETWSNLSLDPKASNYIEKVIGNSTQVVLEDNGSYYIQKQGTYINKSRYIRVKQVNQKTPDYFDNNGNVKSQYTSSIPQVQSGSFSGAVGDLYSQATGSAAKFYEDVTTGNIQGLTSTDYDTALQLLGNTDDYKYSSITAPGLTSQNASSTVTTLVNNSVSRGDNLAVVDLVNYQANVGTVTTQAAGFDSSYAATYWPWLQTIDPETGQQVWVPASTMIPGVLAFTDRSSDAWFAPAGLTRGALGNVIRAERKLPTSTRDTLYEANINPIATFPQSGVVVFGQKTLQKRATALDRVNVRRLLITLKSYITQIADQLVFEQNTIATRNSFLTQVNPYLETVQQRQGLYAFRVIMDESNNGADVVDRNELVGQIFLQPTKTAEYILLDFNVTPTGASFPA